MDLIDRKRLIDEHRKHCMENQGDTFESWSLALMKEAPALMKWTPCDDMMPTRDGKYLVSRAGRVEIAYCGIPLLPMNTPFGKSKRGWYECTNDGDFYSEADAWMELPKPHREERDDKKGGAELK